MQTSPPAGDARLAPGSPALARLTGGSTIAILLAVAAVGVYAALELRPLYADGSNYLLRVLEYGSFRPAPARQTVELIRQAPLQAAVALGVGDLHALAVIFGLSIQLMPLAIVGLSWVALPRPQKHLFVFPLLHLVAGTMAGAFAPIPEGATAAAYFWLLLYCLMFNPARPAALALLVVLGAGTALLHEAMVFLAPPLAAVAHWRARGQPRGRRRSIFLGLTIWFLAAAALHAYFILDPAHPDNRDSFFGAMLQMYWIAGFEGSRNLPALLGVLGVLAVAIIGALKFVGAPWVRWLGWVMIGALGAYSAWEVARAIAGGDLPAASAQFNARNNGLLLSLPLAAAAFLLAIRPRAVPNWVFVQALCVCVVLAAGSVAWHVEAVRDWTRYTGVVARVLAQHSGYVAWDTALSALPPAERRTMLKMAHGWVEPALSVALAPGGNVRTIIGPSQPTHWQGFDPRRPETLPRARFWRYDEYLAALARQTR